MDRTKSKVKVIHYAPISLAVWGARLCTDTVDKSDSNMTYGEPSGDYLGPKDKELLVKRILSSKGKLDPAHESVIEHLVYSFYIKDISRAVLQEIARHRISSPSVKSTRFALQKIKNMNDEELKEQLVKTGHVGIDLINFRQLSHVRNLKTNSVPNDKAKYALPDAFKTEMLWTMNARSLRNLFVLRTSKRALQEFQDIAWGMYDSLPDHHKFIFDDCLHDRDGQ